MDKATLRRICRETDLYSTPSVNDRLYLHYKVRTQPTSNRVLIGSVSIRDSVVSLIWKSMWDLRLFGWKETDL